MSDPRPSAALAMLTFGFLGTAVRPARAHGFDHAMGHDPLRLWIAGGLLLVGMVLLVGSLSLEQTTDVDGRLIDVGVAVGTVLLVGALVTFWF